MGIHVEHIQRQYSESEMLEFGKLQAGALQRIASLEDEKKGAMDHFKSEISAQHTIVQELAKRINMGYEIIPTPCDVIMNQPTKGMKSIVDKKTLAVIKVLPMTDQDRQGSFFEEE